MLNTKGLVTLTEYQQMGWRLIKVENCDNLSETHSQMWFYFLMKFILFYK